MLFAVDELGPPVYHRVAGEDALLHGFFDPLLDRRPEVMRYDPTDDLVDELEAGAPLQRLDLDPAHAVLPMAARLLDVAALGARGAPNRLAVGDTGRA